MTFVKFLLLFCLAVSLHVKVPNVFSGEPDKNLHERCLYPTVRLGVHGYRGQGSGFIVRSDKVGDEYQNVVLTCAHCVPFPEGRYKITVFEYKNWSEKEKEKTYDAHVYASSYAEDLAVLLFVSKKKMPTAKLNFSPKLFLGNEVFKIGFGLADLPRIDYGRITAIRETVPSLVKDGIRSSCFTVPGDSGGPLLHEYEVIGLNKCIRVAPNELGPVRVNQMAFNIMYAVPLDALKKWSEGLNKLVNFSYDEKEKLPILPFTKLKYQSFGIEPPKMPWEI